MLSRLSVERCKAVLAARYPDVAVFSALSPVAKIAALASDIAHPIVHAFVLYYSVRAKLVAPGTPDHTALRLSLGVAAPGAWHKGRPPRNAFEMGDPNRTPSWAEEYTRTNTIAAGLAFADTLDEHAIAAAVRAEFDIGGFEDLGDPAAIGPADPTMKLFLDAVRYALTMVRPEWCTATGDLATALPDGADARAKAVIEFTASEKIRLAKVEERKKREADRRADYVTLYAAHRATSLSSLPPEVREELGAIGAALIAAGFEQAKVLTAAELWLDPVKFPIVETLAASLLPSPLPTDPQDQAADRVSAVTDAVGFLQQEVFTQMAVTHDWFLTKNNGDLTLRRAVPKARTTPTREEKATDNGLYALLDRYGAALVGARIERIWGKPDALAGVTPVVRPVDPVA